MRIKRISVVASAGAILVVLALVCTSCGGGGGGSEPSRGSSQPEPWFQGGTLHNATVGQWKAAAYNDKLATAGDWLCATKWNGHLNTPGDFDRLKGKAEMLVKAIDGSLVSGNKMDSMRVNEVAVALCVMSNNLGP